MTFTILGCGTSTGVPLIHCSCTVCQSDHPKNKRLRASVWFQVLGKSLLIDTSTDLRQQALQAKIPRIDAVLYTHPHADHIHGIDELRSFNFVQKEAIPVFGNGWTCRELKAKFSYIFHPGPIQGGGIPQLELHEFDAHATQLEIAGINVIPIPVAHGKSECVGYRIGSTAYITDCSEIPASSLKKLSGITHLILDCVRIEAHDTHFNLESALRAVEEIRPESTYLTHLGHDFDYSEYSRILPKGVFLAYDGLRVES
jgi:phosphoribosyl 1,2-cyclic phosphate phosphodiesterase